MTTPHTNVWCRYSNLSTGAGTVDSLFFLLGMSVVGPLEKKIIAVATCLEGNDFPNSQPCGMPIK